MHTYRQGDVLLIETDGMGSKKVEWLPRDRTGRIVLAYGEATGHSHAIFEEDADVLLADDELYLQVKSMVSVRHEEHTSIQIPPAIYLVRIQREWSDDNEPVQVKD